MVNTGESICWFGVETTFAPSFASRALAARVPTRLIAPGAFAVLPVLLPENAFRVIRNRELPEMVRALPRCPVKTFLETVPLPARNAATVSVPPQPLPLSVLSASVPAAIDPSSPMPRVSAIRFAWIVALPKLPLNASQFALVAALPRISLPCTVRPVGTLEARMRTAASPA